MYLFGKGNKNRSLMTCVFVYSNHFEIDLRELVKKNQLVVKQHQLAWSGLFDEGEVFRYGICVVLMQDVPHTLNF